MSAIFYVLGYVPIFMYQSKYIQVNFLLSPVSLKSAPANEKNLINFY